MSYFNLISCYRSEDETTQVAPITLNETVIRDYQQGELAHIITAERVLSYEQETEIEKFTITSLIPTDEYEAKGVWLHSLKSKQTIEFKEVEYQTPTLRMNLLDGLLDLNENRLTTESPLTIEQQNLVIEATSLIWQLDTREMLLNHVTGTHRDDSP
jgi:hypothetical protein